MYPVLFELNLGSLGQFTVGTYGLFYATGFLLALRVAIVYARREGIETGRIIDLGIVTLLAGFVGAKLLLYLLDAPYYLRNPIEMIRSLRSAGVFYGGFVLALLAAILYIRRFRLPLGRVFDLAAPALALGQGVGRMGCLAAGCCYGKVCHLPWAVTFTDPRAYELTGVPLDVPLHPTQIYHALAAFIILGITLVTMRRRRFVGQVFWVYVLTYAIARLVVEVFRGDAARGLFIDGTVSTSQLIAIPAILLSIGMLVYLPRRRSASPESSKRR